MLNTAKMMSTAYKLERATEKLQKVANKLDSKIDQSKIISRPQVLRAVKAGKDGYATNVNVQKKYTTSYNKRTKELDEGIDVQQKIESIPGLKCKVKITMQFR